MFRAIDPAYQHHDPHRVPGTVVYGRRDPPVGPSAARFLIAAELVTRLAVGWHAPKTR